MSVPDLIHRFFLCKKMPRKRKRTLGLPSLEFLANTPEHDKAMHIFQRPNFQTTLELLAYVWKPELHLQSIFDISSWTYKYWEAQAKWYADIVDFYGRCIKSSMPEDETLPMGLSNFIHNHFGIPSHFDPYWVRYQTMREIHDLLNFFFHIHVNSRACIPEHICAGYFD